MVWLLGMAVWWFIRGRGASLSGDEPHYLVLARMLAHGSLHPLAYYEADVRTHALFAWPGNLLADTASWHAYQGPHGLVSIHGLGLPLVLAPFVALAGRSGGVAGLLAVEAVALVYLFARACTVAGHLFAKGRPAGALARPARVVAAVAMAGPAVWLAATQLYPDFLAGLVLAIALIEVARLEATGRLDAAGMVVPGLALGLAPWLHIKDAAPVVVVLAALGLSAVRHRAVGRALVTAGIVGLSGLLLLAYNLYFFGHVLGEPQPQPTPSRAAITHGLGLLFDRHQGLVVQVPTVVLGLVGLWMARRLVPWAVAATVLVVAVLLYLNATYVGVPYGGTALAGRFSWSDMAPILAWVPCLVAGIGSLRRLWVLGTACVAAWVLQAVPILAGTHAYYNAQIASAPWDPSSYPGWWGRLDRILPEMVPKGPQWGSPAWALLVAVGLAASIGVAVQFGLLRPRGPAPVRAGATAAVAIAAGLLAWSVPPRLPAGPLIFPGSNVGSPVVAASDPVSVGPIPLQTIGAGTFSVTTSYRVTSGSAVLAAYCTGGTTTRPGRRASFDSRRVAGGSDEVTLALRCPAGTLWFRDQVQPASRIDIDRVTVRKN